MTYRLRRTRDGAGDSGPMSTVYWKDEETGEIKHENGKPKVGAVLRVGSFYARTYDMQDWWQTTIITEILEEKENYVRFKTTNSEYEWERF